MKALTKELLIKYVYNHCPETGIEGRCNETVGIDHRCIPSGYSGPFITSDGYDGPSIYEDAIECSGAEEGATPRMAGDCHTFVIPFTNVEAVNDIVAEYVFECVGKRPEVTLMDFLSDWHLYKAK